MQLFPRFATLALLTTLPAVAQTHYCIGGDLNHMTPAEVKSCQITMSNVRDAVHRRGAPSGWRFLVVCDEGSWQDVAALTGHAEGVLRDASFQTDAAMQITFLRGSRVAGAADGAARVVEAALKGVPAAPGTDGGTAPIPNVEQRHELPGQLMAEEHLPEPHEVANGQ